MGVFNQIMRVCLEVCLVLVVMTAVQGCSRDKEKPKTCTGNSQCNRDNQRCIGKWEMVKPGKKVYSKIIRRCQPSNHVNGNWGGWGAYSQCSVTCGGAFDSRYANGGPGNGYRTRTRRCDNPRPRVGTKYKNYRMGDDCYGKSTQRISGCNAHACPVTDADVSTWGVWGACSTTCGGGSMFRSRSCVPPRNGGRRCPTELTFISQCNTNQCPVHGNWGRWHQITTCSGPCGGATLQRVRSCDKPSPMFGGHECRGERDETRACNRRGCPGVG